MNERTVAQLLLRRAEETPDQPYVRCGGDWITHADMVERAGRVAAALSRIGVGQGDRVAMIVPNREEMLELFFGCAFLGAMQVPLNAWLKGEFLRYQLLDSDPTVLVGDEAGLRAAAPLLAGSNVRELIALDKSSLADTGAADRPVHLYADLVSEAGNLIADVSPQDITSIIYTSGTTGDPKGCMLSNSYYVAGPGCLLERGWLEAGDRLFTSFPLFHTSGQVICLMSALLARGSVAVEPEFSASAFIDRARALEASVLCGVGFMGAALLAQPPRPDDGLNPFRVAWWIPMDPRLQLQFEERFAIPVMAEAFGQTECFPLTMAPAHAPRHRMSLGPALTHFEVQLVDADDHPVGPDQVGEIVVRPREPGVMYSGYWRKPEATVSAWRNLWHHTGDLAVRQADGNMSFVDRKKDALRRRGENVSSIELETAIQQHPDIAQVVICAVPSVLGEDDIKAVVVESPGASLTPDEFFDFLRTNLPYFAVPRYVHIRDGIPTNALGRIMKQILRDEGVTEEMWDFDRMGLTIDRAERRG